MSNQFKDIDTEKKTIDTFFKELNAKQRVVIGLISVLIGLPLLFSSYTFFFTSGLFVMGLLFILMNSSGILGILITLFCIKPPSYHREHLRDTKLRQYAFMAFLAASGAMYLSGLILPMSIKLIIGIVLMVFQILGLIAYLLSYTSILDKTVSKFIPDDKEDAIIS